MDDEAATCPACNGSCKCPTIVDEIPCLTDCPLCQGVGLMDAADAARFQAMMQAETRLLLQEDF